MMDDQYCVQSEIICITVSQVRQRLSETGDPGPVTMIRTPLVDLPLGATEDRVCGTIDFERALTEGESPEMGVYERGADDCRRFPLCDTTRLGWDIPGSCSITVW